MQQNKKNCLGETTARAASPPTNQPTNPHYPLPPLSKAKRFCARQGWHATVVAEPRPSGRRLARFAGYGDNFTVKRGGVPDLSHLPSRRGGGSGGSGSGSSAADGTADGAPRG
jgi:NADH dehydrogenase (ubiquinone) Fe-S protein 4